MHKVFYLYKNCAVALYVAYASTLVGRKMPESLVGTLPKEKLDLIAKEKLNEDPARLHSDLDAIKQWIKKQPHLDGHVPIGEHSKMVFVFKS